MFPDPLRLTVALLPIAVYGILIGVINARRRPFVTTGGCDLAALGAALSGMVLIGPVELFRPEAAAPEFGRYYWLFLLIVYWLGVWLAVLLARPRVVIYNASINEVRPVLAEAAREVDGGARWAGDSLVLPSLGVRMHLEELESMRHVSLIASGAKQNLAGWRQLSASLYDKIEELPVQPNPRALGILLLAMLLIGVSVSRMLADPQRVVQAFEQMFFL